jgi:hypothetical protein
MVTLAQVVRQVLIDLQVGQIDSVKDWFITVSYLPDSPQVRDSIITVTDTEGNRDGRIMATGETVIHPGCQIRVRATEYTIGYNKLKQIQTVLDKLHNYMTKIGSTIVQMQTISQQGGIMPMGLDQTGRRYHFSLNYIATIRFLDET